MTVRDTHFCVFEDQSRENSHHSGCFRLPQDLTARSRILSKRAALVFPQISPDFGASSPVQTSTKLFAL